jgi:hypothetical protein
MGEELQLAPPGDDGNGTLPSTVHLEPDRDNTLYEHPGGVLSNGAGIHLFAGVNAGGQIRRAVIRFDVEGSLPAGAVVDSVWLDLECSRVRNDTGQLVSVHRVTAGWGEGTSDALDEEGQGNVSTPGDATWIHREFDTLFWSSPGGDFDPVESASVSVAGVGTYRWGATDAMASDVQGWLDDPAANHGWLILGNESGNETAKRFQSREHGTAGSRPRLTVVFVPPE